MNRFKVILACVLASTTPMLSGCVPLAGAVGAVDSVASVITATQPPADRVFNTLADEKAYYGILKFEATANQLASTAVDIGVVAPGSRRAIQIADLLLQLTSVTNAAKQAKNLNDTPGLTGKIREGQALYTQLIGLMR